jgi:hypothetical protein
MRNIGRILRIDVPALVTLVVVLVLALPLRAAADVAIYQSLVPIKGASAADKADAFAEALRTTAVRASGRRDAGSNPVIAAAAADPDRYVQQYSTTPDRYLKVGFNAQAIERLLQQAGLPLWPLERPVTQVLLVVPSAGGGARAIIDADHVPEKAEVERAAQARGLPISWPRGTVSAASVRASVAGGAANVESDRTFRPLLAGIGTGAAVNWRFTQPGQSASADGSIDDGVNLAADSLASRYAPPSTRGTSSFDVRVRGIEGVEAYAGLLEYLQSLSLVRDVQVQEMTDGVVTLKLTVRGDLELLRRIAAMDEKLRAAAPATVEGGGSAVDFTYQP